MTSLVGQVSFKETQGDEPSLNPKNGQRNGFEEGQLLRGMQGVSWGTHPRRGQNFWPPSAQNWASERAAFINATELVVLKHWTMERTHWFEKLENNNLGSGGVDTSVRSIERWTWASEESTVRMNLERASHSAHIGNVQFEEHPVKLLRLHEAEQKSGQVLQRNRNSDKIRERVRFTLSNSKRKDSNRASRCSVAPRGAGGQSEKPGSQRAWRANNATKDAAPLNLWAWTVTANCWTSDDTHSWDTKRDELHSHTNKETPVTFDMRHRAKISPRDKQPIPLLQKRFSTINTDGVGEERPWA
jgi:hypothetical protein